MSVVELLFKHAKEYATLANRVTPTPHDLLAACEDRGMSATQLRLASKKKKRKRGSSGRKFYSFLTQATYFSGAFSHEIGFASSARTVTRDPALRR